MLRALPIAHQQHAGPAAGGTEEKYPAGHAALQPVDRRRAAGRLEPDTPRLERWQRIELAARVLSLRAEPGRELRILGTLHPAVGIRECHPELTIHVRHR